MSSTTTTQYYGLTQYIGTDKPDFADNNQAFRNVDADLHQVVQDSQGFTSDIADLTERVGNLNTDLTNLSGDLDGEKAKITALQNKELSQDTEIARVERNAQDMITAYNEASATSTHAYAVGDYFIYNNVLYQATAAIAVGATIVPDTNCTTTNVTNELIQLNNNLSMVENGINTASPSSELRISANRYQLEFSVDTSTLSANTWNTIGSLPADAVKDTVTFNFEKSIVIVNEGGYRFAHPICEEATTVQFRFDMNSGGVQIYCTSVPSGFRICLEYSK